MSFKLLCWVIGTPTKRIFPVKVGHDGIWDEVKDAVKEKKKIEFNDIDADILKLWKVTIDNSQHSLLESGDFLKCAMAKNPLDPLGSLSTEVNDRLPDNHINIIIVQRPTSAGRPDIKGKRKAEAEPDADHGQRQTNVGAPEDSKRLKIDRDQGREESEDRRLPSEATLQDYHNMFQHVSDDPQWYSNPQNCQTIPFPFTVSPERFSVQDGKFEYMGRESFRKVHEKVSSLEPGGGNRLYIQGSMGFGKSHILAALACLLYQQSKLVVFIPDAPHSQRNGSGSEPANLRAIYSFYNGFPSFPYLIVDQINAFEISDFNTDPIPREEKDTWRIFINKLTVGSLTITSASANYQTATYMSKKQTNEIKLPLMGGMTTEEMAQWWHHYKDKLPNFEDRKEIVEVEELTGRIPLLLRPLLRFSQQNYCAVDFWACPEIAAVRENIKEFSESRRAIGERVYNEYLETLCSCITRGGISWHRANSYDYRYFYPEGRNCHYTCGLAREAATSIIAKRKHGKFYEPEWIDTLRFYKNNPSALGTQVELICLACITDMGLNYGDVHIKPKVPVNFFGDLNTLLAIIPSTPQPGFSQLYLPENPRFEDIDGAYVEYIHELKTVHVVPMQVTINGRHKDSEALFYNKWAKWESKFSEYELTSTFAWIVESEIHWAEIVEQTRQTRQTTQLIAPEHRQAVIPMNVHKPLADELARIRGGTSSESFGGLSIRNPPNEVSQTQMNASSSKPMKPTKALTAHNLDPEVKAGYRGRAKTRKKTRART